MAKPNTYETLRHDVETKMLNASNLKTEPEQRTFINETFTSLYTAYQEKRVNSSEYIKLINRLAAYKQGQFNDYIDILAGAAKLGMLETVIKGNVPQLSPEQARQRRDAITDITGVQPVNPEKE